MRTSKCFPDSTGIAVHGAARIQGIPATVSCVYLPATPDILACQSAHNQRQATGTHALTIARRDPRHLLWLDRSRHSLSLLPIPGQHLGLGLALLWCEGFGVAPVQLAQFTGG